MYQTAANVTDTFRASAAWPPQPFLYPGRIADTTIITSG